MNNKTLFNKALGLINASKEKEAEQLLKLLLTKDLESNLVKKVYYKLAEIEKERGLYFEAIDFFLKILNEPVTEQEIVDVHFQTGNLFFLQIEKENLKHPDDSSRMQFLSKEAARHFEISRNVKFIDYYIDSSILLGDCYFGLDENEKALQVLEPLDSMDLTEEEKREVYSLIGSSYFAIGNYRTAIDWLTKIDLDIRDQHTTGTLLQLGKAYFLLGDPITALKFLLQIFILHQELPGFIKPERLDVARSISEEVFEEIFNEKLIDDCLMQKIFTFNSKEPMTAYHYGVLGDFLTAIGDKDKAEFFYRKRDNC